jgi:hypothetical protein
VISHQLEIHIETALWRLKELYTNLRETLTFWTVDLLILEMLHIKEG